ncbi:hypothetical protein AKJ41_00720 [candidate division MSBL1 archaeon SCGC-AAA259O05]|uniref:ArsR family transcriptional regulator n=1 Tax=candidate division MSBL1 archaeon SCGC-AAA259O05 TaxID=1698271 RepID=A0A133V5D1_9EURY|nr:hypothetical protein AKJ41_00720 [candidate division MSBL1 archaeon SCGC-AAA259O05]
MPEELESSLLLEVFGKSPEFRVVDVFVDNFVFDLTVDEIFNLSGLDPEELGPILNKLRSWSIVTEGGREGSYTLNTDVDAVGHLLLFEHELIRGKLGEG